MKECKPRMFLQFRVQFAVHLILIYLNLEALLIHLPIQVMNGAISKIKRAKISSQYMKECKPRMSKSIVQFAVH